MGKNSSGHSSKGITWKKVFPFGVFLRKTRPFINPSSTFCPDHSLRLGGAGDGVPERRLVIKTYLVVITSGISKLQQELQVSRYCWSCRRRFSQSMEPEELENHGCKIIQCQPFHIWFLTKASMWEICRQAGSNLQRSLPGGCPGTWIRTQNQNIHCDLVPVV